MNKVYLIISIAVAVIIFVAIYFIYNNQSQNMNNTNILKGNQAALVSEMQDFSCPNIKGFTFKYPVYKGWEVVNITNSTSIASEGQECSIILKNPNYREGISLKSIANIIITKTPYTKQDFEIPVEAISNLNPNKVPTWYMKEDLSGGDYTPSHYAYVVFYGNDYKYFVSVNDLSTTTGFPVDDFFQSVIQSFKISDL